MSITRHLSDGRAMAATLLLATGCGGGGTEPVNPPPSPPPAVPSSIVAQAGANQTARIGTAVSTAPVFVVRDQNQQPMANVAVHFDASGGGTLGVASATTGSDGTASPGSWTLGSTHGQQTVTAQVTSNTSVATTVTATARYPYWNVLVYMAADNNLAVQGLLDIDEMERGQRSPEVQVVVQAEFSPTQLAQYGCDASCINRPNLNTFRYQVTTNTSNQIGPDGAATDIGNVNMADPATLRSFIQWGQSTYPAENTLVVLWNHGGGYTGLLQDETSNALMPLNALPSAVQGLGVDVLDFDMCLMGGYETLAVLSGIVPYAVFSEEVVPGAGNDYESALDGIAQQASSSPREVAMLVADRFNAAYAGSRESTTISAYDLGGFAAADQALGTLADALRSNIAPERNSIAAATAHLQRYEYPQLADMGDLLDSLRLKVSTAGLDGLITQAKSAVTASTFRLRSLARNGTSSYSNSVQRSTGLSILMPNSAAGAGLNSTGPLSLSAYRSQVGDRPWTLFLADWVAADPGKAVVDQGTNRLETYLVWDTASVSRQVDVDFIIAEPDGSLFAPFLGSVTPNGTFSGDSYDTETAFEAYRTNQIIEVGTYKMYALLSSDPMDHRPLVDLVYRYGQSAQFQSLYAPNFPVLSRQVSIFDDPNPTLAKVEAGSYTDFIYVAHVTFGSSPTPRISPPAHSDVVAAPNIQSDSGPGRSELMLSAWLRSHAKRHVRRDGLPRALNITTIHNPVRQ